ncbi:MAG: ABC transporter ATP-binding protein [Gemmatimonadetes bacterium]|nr:ABC transporter ATP-binding protein [Gemmatimonadota bacterium]
MAAITLDRVGKTYPNGHVAAWELCLEIADGELVVLVGPSGSGKSTALRMVAGLETPTSGRILIGGDDVTDTPPQDRDLAMVFQSYALYPHKTVRENLAFPLRMRRAPRMRIDERVAAVADALGLRPLLDRKPAQLSGGQRQRVALGRAMVREPRAFLFDEPLSNLDPALRVHTRAELALLHRRLAATMLYVTHDQEEAMTLGDRIVVMRDGAIQQAAPPLDVYLAPANRFVAAFIGSPAMNFFDCAVTADATGARLVCGALGVSLATGPDAPEPADVPGGGFAAQPGPAGPVSPAAGTAVHAAEPADRATAAAVAARATRRGRVVLGVRPHDIVLVGEGPADARGEVAVVEPLGAEQIVHVRMAGLDETVRVVAPAERRVTPDEPVGLRFRRDRLHLFDAETGARLEA